LNHHRCSDERFVSLLTRLRKILVVGVSTGMLGRNGLTQAYSQAYEALAKLETDLTYGRRVKPNRCAEPQVFKVGLREIDGADLCGQTLRNQTRNVGEGLRKVVGACDDLGDIGEN
jgi:hypothetical protein